MSVICRIASDVGVRENELRQQVRHANKRVKRYKITKRDGESRREIAVAPRVHKMIQYWFISTVLRPIPVGDAATAYLPGSSILKNAEQHRNGNYFFRLDVQDFFHSLQAKDLRLSFEDYGDAVGREVLDSFEDEDFIASVFYKERCAVGYPASPYIANIVMRHIDSEILRRLSLIEDRTGRPTYTRYADDITISIEHKGFKREVVELVEGVFRDTESPLLRLNAAKTKFGSRRGGSGFVTGLRICRDGRLTLHRKYKDHVRLLMSLEEKGVLDEDERPSLMGHLNFCQAVDPGFYTKLASKYFKVFRRLQGGE